MKLKNVIPVLGMLLLMAGCASISLPRATVADQTIQNASLGFSGFIFEIPAGFTVYNPAVNNPGEYNELQQMAIRIYDLNKAWHPRGDELFYESFLLMSDETCFLLITLKSDVATGLDDSLLSDETVANWQLMPLYNATATRTLEMGENRFSAVYTRGSAYEKKGWYYARPKRESRPFSYEACKVTGGNRDSYVLMGFAQPEQADALTSPMRQMVESMKF